MLFPKTPSNVQGSSFQSSTLHLLAHKVTYAMYCTFNVTMCILVTDIIYKGTNTYTDTKTDIKTKHTGVYV